MSFKLNPLSAIIIACFVNAHALASVVRSDIPYQTYRDFGENKGQFVVGATNLPIYGKNGELIGTLDKAPMVDFSSASTDGVGTLVAPQYSGSVKHNTGYGSLRFGGTGNNPDYLRHTYLMVDRNNTENNFDYHAPRLHKYVTEVAPANLLGLNYIAYTDKNRFTALYRTGSGTQYLRDPEWNVTFLSAPYNYLTGGTVTPLYRLGNLDTVWADNGGLYDNTDVSPLTSYAGAGDSGSPLYAWDTQTKQWILVGFQIGGMANNATPGNIFSAWAAYLPNFNQARYAEDTDPFVENSSDLIWAKTNDGKTATFAQADKSWTSHIKDETVSDTYSGGYNNAMNAGKNITLNGSGGTITLQDSINQGAGGLTFHNDYTVQPQDNQTWQGAGLIIGKDSTVTWKINGVENDFLHKIGEGTLKIEAKGKNLGSLSAGDGTTILAQQADEKGEVQAFDKVRLASGRPTVVLGDNKQVNPDNIYFGFRGGRLDINGNDLTFERIHNVDNGAQIVNHNGTQAANIRVVGDTNYTIYNWSAPYQGIVGTIYQYPQRDGSIQYFRLKTPNYWYFPNAASNDRWEYLGTDRDKAVSIYLEAKNKAMYQGILGETDSAKTNGELNFTYSAPTSSSIYTLSGGSNLNGEIKVDNGTLLLSGYPTLHAEDTLNQRDVVIDNDWVTADFKADTFKAESGATLQLGNYANLEGNIVADADSKISLGYSKGANDWDNNWKCTRSDSSGVVSCNQTALSDALYSDLPYAQVKGNITLAENANLNLGKTQYQGAIQGAATSRTHLMHDAIWTMAADSTLGHLSTDSGATVKLNGDSQSGNFNTLIVNGNLSGDGRFELNSSFADMKSDRVIVNGLASGNYLLALQDSGKTSGNNVNRLPLLTLNNPTQDWNKINASLQNGHLDFGAFRYTLEHDNDSFVLYNALVPDATPPTEEPTAPAEQPTTPTEEPTSPAEQPTAPAEQPTVPTEEPTSPAEQPTAPTEQPTAPAEEPTTPTEQPTTPIEQPSVPASQNNWISQGSNTALSDHSARLNLLTKQQTLLNQYINRLTAENSGLWTNVDRERLRYHSDHYRSYKQDLYTQQIGADKATAFDGGNWLFGLAFTHSSGKNEFAENQNGKTDNHALSVYHKVIWDNDLYLSAVVSYNRLKSKLNALAHDVKQNAWTTSVGIGKRWQFGTVGVQPSFDLTYYRLSGVDYRLNDMTVQSKALDFWQARSGIMLDKSFGFEQGDGVKLYTALYYVANLDNNAQLSINNNALNAALFKNRLQSEVGAVFGLGRHFNITLKGGYAKGNVIESQVNGGLELKYIW
ncbi:outer membrane autotransporter barrel domain-containing protein [Pasteurella testudinis DSM 23072]|uniref:Outer membrane autotransporter barrel domain-containing protein n=1 Tax=Pasteurella testudinis DSM 23072 TaxID=1122938 RepID=A0A1W1UHU8_9PAST|nr:S6 family peptidase [Pasteurella testudinis]SMB80602.1 outer membrane autotransporter barrel domain-containing protein [Pasteurella testudinis DSM 23072]SUB51931.1 Adhesion and penetration protein autotransporter precursor [Pasteurella testudinis]